MNSYLGTHGANQLNREVSLEQLDRTSKKPPPAMRKLYHTIRTIQWRLLDYRTSCWTSTTRGYLNPPIKSLILIKSRLSLKWMRRALRKLSAESFVHRRVPPPSLLMH